MRSSLSSGIFKALSLADPSRLHIGCMVEVDRDISRRGYNVYCHSHKLNYFTTDKFITFGVGYTPARGGLTLPKTLKTEIAIQPVTGWRMWQFTHFNDGSGMVPRLLSSHQTIWPVDGWLKAECWANGKSFIEADRRHEAPQTYCSCGIYARKSRDMVENEQFYQGGIWGEVELGGLVVEASHGYVASHAFPKKLYVYDQGCPPDTDFNDMRVAASSSVYGCKCTSTELAEAIAEAYGIELEKIVKPCPCRAHDHGEGDLRDEYRGARAVYTDSAARAWTTYTSNNTNTGIGSHISSAAPYTGAGFGSTASVTFTNANWFRRALGL